MGELPHAGHPALTRWKTESFRTINGYSTGKWEGDTLVVSTNGLHDGTWLGTAGTPLTGAVDVLTRSLATELGPRKILVNAVLPGAVETVDSAFQFRFPVG